MKKAIYTGIFYTILGLCINTPANASLISRGFLDQALTDYATTTALDLKANQSDLTDLSSKIGTLPTTITAEGFYGDYTLPDNIGEQLNIIFYGNNERINYIPGLMELNQMILDLATNGPANEIWDSLYNGLEKKLISGAWHEWRGLTEMDTNIKNNTAKIGTLPDGYESVGAALTTMDARIGTLPSGGFGSSFLEDLFKSSPAADAIGTPAYPNSLSDLIYQLYGNNAVGHGIIDSLMVGFEVDEYGDVGILSAFSMAKTAKTAAETAQATATEAKTAADANTAKIGTVPTEYATVGEALSAIKGIAEEAKAAALAAIPDPKTEGSNGKYVLTVDILEGDATYRWEPIDRGNTTATTE